MAIGATGPSGAIRPTGSRSSTASSLPSDDLSLTSLGLRRSTFNAPLGWSSRPSRSLSYSLPPSPILLNQPKGRLRGRTGVAGDHITLAFDDLEEAIAANGDVTRRIRMKRRLSWRQHNPIFALYMSGQAGARPRRQAQRAVSSSAINVVRNRAAHRVTIATQPPPAIASAV
jgi:hypothetical protein